MAWHHKTTLLCVFNQSCKISVKMHIRVIFENFSNRNLLVWAKLCSLFIYNLVQLIILSRWLQTLYPSLTFPWKSKSIYLTAYSTPLPRRLLSYTCFKPANHLPTKQITCISCSYLFLDLMPETWGSLPAPSTSFLNYPKRPPRPVHSTFSCFVPI